MQSFRDFYSSETVVAFEIVQFESFLFRTHQFTGEIIVDQYIKIFTPYIPFYSLLPKFETGVTLFLQFI